MMNDNGLALSQDIVSSQQMYCSMKAESTEQRTALFNAMTNPTGRLSDLINTEINVVDIYCEMVHMTSTDQNTGEYIEQDVPRTVLITESGESYSCVSMGVYSAIKKLIALFGEPTWNPPLKLMVKQIKKGKNNILNLELK